MHHQTFATFELHNNPFPLTDCIYFSPAKYLSLVVVFSSFLVVAIDRIMIIGGFRVEPSRRMFVALPKKEVSCDDDDRNGTRLFDRDIEDMMRNEKLTPFSLSLSCFFLTAVLTEANFYLLLHIIMLR